MVSAINKRTKEKDGETVSGREQSQDRILSAALKLLNGGGQDAVTTRAVAQLAGVQPPVIYRLFTDKTALLNALAEHGFTLYLAKKQSRSAEQDPVEALRLGWDRHIQFGLDYPPLYLLMYAQPQAGTGSAAELSFAMLRAHVGRVAAAGRLRIPEERAVALFHSMAVGIVLILLRSRRDKSDYALSGMARDSVLSIIAVTEEVVPESSPIAAAAATLDAAVTVDDGFSPAEFGLFREWLRRLKDV